MANNGFLFIVCLCVCVVLVYWLGRSSSHMLAQYESSAWWPVGLVESWTQIGANILIEPSCLWCCRWHILNIHMTHTLSLFLCPWDFGARTA